MFITVTIYVLKEEIEAYINVNHITCIRKGRLHALAASCIDVQNDIYYVKEDIETIKEKLKAASIKGVE